MINNFSPISLVGRYLDSRECQKCRRVSTKWDAIFGKILIDRLNIGKPFTSVLLGVRSYELLLNWLQRNKFSIDLNHADFFGIKEMRKGDWSQLNKICSRISKLILFCQTEPEYSMLSKGGLNKLSGFPQLTVLDLSGNTQFFGEDMLSIFQGTTFLEKVNFLGMIYLRDKDLISLTKQSNLKELTVAGCQALSPQFLEMLRHFPKLTYLNIEECNQLQSTCLMNLRFTPLLERINFIGCYQLGEVNISLLPKTRLHKTKAVLGKHIFMYGKL